MSHFSIKNLTADSKVFCMLPWVHLHTWPGGNVFPCCMVNDTRHALGNLNQNKLKEIWNGEKLRKLRISMLAGSKSSACERCYIGEAHGRDSLRQYSNKRFLGQTGVVEKTDTKGYVAELNVRYWDFRLTNLCNFRCRTCGPELSSSWYREAKVLLPHLNIPERVLDASRDGSLWPQINPLFDIVEEVYFAGGEPMLDQNHWRILEELIKRGRTGVTLTYSTNLSTLEYRGKNVLELWRKFPRVTVNASIDGSGRRGEYIRKGLSWERAVLNMRKIRERCPHVDLGLYPTLSIFNSLHLPDLHREVVELGLVKKHRFAINILNSPEYYQISILPNKLKKRLKALYLKHIEEFLEADEDPQLLDVINGFRGAIKFSQQKSNFLERSRFVDFSLSLDSMRHESFVKTFPELADFQKMFFLQHKIIPFFKVISRAYLEFCDALVRLRRKATAFFRIIKAAVKCVVMKPFYFFRYQYQKRILKIT